MPNDYARTSRRCGTKSPGLHGEERSRGVFDRVHVAPASSADIPDLENTRLVIVHPRHSLHKQDGPDSPTHKWVRNAVETKGAGQRIHRNTLIFLVADTRQLETLEAATRSYLGWKQVQTTSDTLNLTAQQRKQADDQVNRCGQAVTDRLRDTFVWAVYPEQFDPKEPFEVTADKVADSGADSLAERVSAKLCREDQLVTTLGAPILGTILHTDLSRLWQEKGEITVGELWGYFTRYTYLPRLVNRKVLDGAIEQALTAILIEKERFAIASEKDEDTGRYRGLIVPPDSCTNVQITDSTLLIDAQRGEEQIEEDRAAATRVPGATTPGDNLAPAALATHAVAGKEPSADDDDRSAIESTMETVLARFFGSVAVNPDRYARDIGNITREVIDQLAGTGANLEITIDIQATKPEGFNDTEIRTITENVQVLKFDPGSGFEKH